jgi:beta-1,4-galactosyltransferase 1
MVQYFRLYYKEYFSGAIILNREQFRRANGFSNDYWGWGGEDDDFYIRQAQKY